MSAATKGHLAVVMKLAELGVDPAAANNVRDIIPIIKKPNNIWTCLLF